ncbi:hypothetical protein TNCV_1986041 [Trichonephila clavipes]|nr:hypothetical protein TNCV_1986041 [Trichonephila clavipes]
MWRNLKWVVPIKVTGWKFIHCQFLQRPRRNLFDAARGQENIFYTWIFPSNSQGRNVRFIPKQQNVMKQLKEIKEKVQMEQDNYWKTIVAEFEVGTDVFKNEFKSKENEWKAERDVLKSDTFKMSF